MRAPAHTVESARRTQAASALAALLVGSAAATGAQVLEPIQIIQPADAAADNFFGNAIELAEGKLFIAAAGRQNGGTAGQGAVYVYDADTLTLLNTITASNTPPTPAPVIFGRSLAVEGDKLLVGSDEPDPDDPQKAGAAYLMQVSTGNQIARYTQTIGDFGTRSPNFGWDVALAGNLAVVGDPDADRDPTGAGEEGTVSFFNITTDQQEARLLSSFQTYSSEFGRSIEIWNDRVYIGGQTADGVRAYDAQSRVLQTEIIAPADPQFFGDDLAIFGDMLAAADSAYFVAEGEFFPTAIYLFDLNTNDLIRTLTVDPDPGDVGLGRFVAFNDQYLLATRFRNSPGFGMNVVVFDVATGDLLTEIEPPIGSEVSFGSGMILDGDLAYINSRPNADFPLPGGAVLVYDLSQIADCPADVNGDGVVSPADFNAWVIAFNTNAPECDQNGDGQCDPSDFNAWIINFNAGC